MTRTRALGAEFEAEVETVAELASRYVEEYWQQHHKSDTQASYRHLLRRYIVPNVSELRIDGLPARDRRAHSRRSPTQGNRMHAALKAILNWGEREELVADGAARCCKHIQKNRSDRGTLWRRLLRRRESFGSYRTITASELLPSASGETDDAGGVEPSKSSNGTTQMLSPVTLRIFLDPVCRPLEMVRINQAVEDQL